MVRSRTTWWTAKVLRAHHIPISALHMADHQPEVGWRCEGFPWLGAGAIMLVRGEDGTLSLHDASANAHRYPVDDEGRNLWNPCTEKSLHILLCVIWHNFLRDCVVRSCFSERNRLSAEIPKLKESRFEYYIMRFSASSSFSVSIYDTAYKESGCNSNPCSAQLRAFKVDINHSAGSLHDQKIICALGQASSRLSKAKMASCVCTMRNARIACWTAKVHRVGKFFMILTLLCVKKLWI